MSRTRIDRRTLLRGLLGGAAVSLGLPILEAFTDHTGRAIADTCAFPKRFGIFFWGNGVHPKRWVPSTTGANWAMSDQLAPLADHRDKITVVSGMRVEFPNIQPHGAGPGGILAGAPIVLQGDQNTFSAPSIDQVIAAEIGGETRYPSIEFGASGDSLSYTGPNSVNPPEHSPFALYNQLFGPTFTLPGETPIIDPKLGLRQSVLDAVGEDVTSLKKRLGTADQQRLEQHLDGIRKLEKRLTKLQENPPNLASCNRPTLPAEDYPDIDGRPQLSAINRALCDVIAMALACDQTRVFSNWFCHPVNNVLFPGAPAGHHQLTHDEPMPQPMVHDIILQIMSELSYFLGALKAVPEGDATLLDHCAILCTTDVSLGQTHSIDEYPIVLAGSACGALKTGIHYRSETNENVSHLLLSLLRAMDLSVAEFGKDEGHVTDSLAAIEAV